MAANIPVTLSSWSTTAGSNQPDSTDLASTLREDLQAIQAAVRYLRTSGTISSASTTDLATKSEEILSVSGTTTITALGTVSAGMIKVLVFEGALTFTHNGTSLILPTAANITTAAGDVAVMLSLGSGNWRCLSYTRASGYAPQNHWVLLDSEAASTAASVTLTGGSATTYRLHKLVLSNVTVSADASLSVRMGSGSVDTGNNYAGTVVQASGTSVTASSSGATSTLSLTGTIEATSNVVGLEATISACTSTARVFLSSMSAFIDNTANLQSWHIEGYYSGSFDRVQVFPSTGTVSGNFALYGLI